MSLGRLKITPREYDILVRLHKNNEEIAEELGISLYTVRAICANLRDKFKAKTRSAIIIKALRFGFVEIKAFEL